MTTKMEHKNILAELLEAAEDSGSFEAVIATTGVVDSDGDVIAAGAMEGNTVPILPAHDSSSVPLGKVRIEERDDKVVAVGKFNMSIQAAREWFSAIKADFDDPPARFEYSWGFIPTKFGFEKRDDVQVRVIEEMDLLEVSPVLRGASVGTRTLSAKQKREDDPETEEEPKVKLVDQIRAAREATADVMERVSELAESRAKNGKHLGDEATKELLQLGEQVEGLAGLCQRAGSIVSSSVDDKPIGGVLTISEAAAMVQKLDEKARALAGYMAKKARWG